MSTQEQGNLKHGLSNRHIQLIALGGAIGTGLFLGISQSIKLAGPSVILGYAIAGFIAFLMMRQLGEMVVEEPVSGSFSHFAYKYWGTFCRLHVRMELLGTQCTCVYGGVKCNWSLYSILVAANPNVGICSNVLYSH